MMYVSAVLAAFFMALVYWQVSAVTLVTSPLPPQSQLYRSAEWSVGNDPWVKQSRSRRYTGVSIIQSEVRVPVGYWVGRGYVADDHRVIFDEESIGVEKLVKIQGGDHFIKDAFDLVNHLYATQPEAAMHISEVGTMTVALPFNRRFVLGRGDWLQQWTKAEKILSKYPQRYSTQYDLRYHDGFALKTIKGS